jgi:hypothetical protein
MGANDNSAARDSERAAQIVRQFAWNLRSTLGAGKGGGARKSQGAAKPGRR